MAYSLTISQHVNVSIKLHIDTLKCGHLYRCHVPMPCLLEEHTTNHILSCSIGTLFFMIKCTLPLISYNYYVCTSVTETVMQLSLNIKVSKIVYS